MCLFPFLWTVSMSTVSNTGRWKQTRQVYLKAIGWGKASPAFVFTHLHPGRWPYLTFHSSEELLRPLGWSWTGGLPHAVSKTRFRIKPIYLIHYLFISRTSSACCVSPPSVGSLAIATGVCLAPSSVLLTTQHPINNRTLSASRASFNRRWDCLNVAVQPNQAGRQHDQRP